MSVMSLLPQIIPGLAEQLGIQGMGDYMQQNGPLAAQSLPNSRVFEGFNTPSGQLAPLGALSRQALNGFSPINRFVNPGPAWGGSSGGSAGPINPLLAQLAQRFGTPNQMRIPAQPQRMTAQMFPGIFGGSYGGAR
jgi:hypothetical protein